MNKNLILIFLLFVSGLSYGQETLTLDQAIQIALDNNYGIRAADKNVELAQNQIFKGNAGMSPIVDWNTGVTSSFNQVHQNYIDGRLINRFGTSLAPSTNFTLQYTLFNGNRMQATYERLKSLGQLSEIQKQQTIQNTIADVMEAYFNIQRLQNTSEFLNEIIKFYEERLVLTEERWQIGRGSKLDYLQSKADLTTQLTDQTNNQIQLKNAKILLNRLVVQDPTRDFSVEKESKEYPFFDLAFFRERIKEKNPAYLAINKQDEINQINQKIAGSYLKPTINLNSSLGYSFNFNNAGLISNNQSAGLNAGLTASWRLFDGKVIKRNIQSEKINADIIRLQKEDLVNTLENQLISAYSLFETQQRLVDLERQNIETAQENLDIAIEKFKLGASTILEINDAQTRYNNIMNRFVNAEYNLSISRLNVLLISGELVK